MQLDVFFTRHDIEKAPPDLFKGATCVVIDVLRASTTLVKALSVGAGEIYIAESPERAFKLRDELGGDTLLCGERYGIIIPGFDLGNSPYEYTLETVAGKRLIFASTNGSATLLACSAADEILIGGFVNLTAIVEELSRADVALLACSGKLGRFCIEDAVCAGMIIDRLLGVGVRVNLLSDSAWTAYWLFERYLAAPQEMLERAEHPVYLARELSLPEDVAFCTAIDALDIVPRLYNGIVTL